MTAALGCCERARPWKIGNMLRDRLFEPGWTS